MNEAATLRPLTTGQLLDTTFSLYRRHFALFFGVAALPYLIGLGFQLFILVLQKTSPSSGLAIGVMIIGFLSTMVAYLISIAITQAASFFAVSSVHLSEPITIGGAFSRVRGHILVVVGTMILVGIATVVGLVLFIVPGVILMLGLSLSIPAVLFENLDPIDGMKRSYELTKGARGRVALLYLLMWAIQMGIGMFTGIAVIAIAGLGAATRPGGMPLGVEILQQVMNFGVNALVAPIVTVGLTLLYYDQRVRKEAFDLQHMMSVLGTQPPSAPPQAAGAGIS
jgi:hypothetical protein